MRKPVFILLFLFLVTTQAVQASPRAFIHGLFDRGADFCERLLHGKTDLDSNQSWYLTIKHRKTPESKDELEWEVVYRVPLVIGADFDGHLTLVREQDKPDVHLVLGWEGKAPETFYLTPKIAIDGDALGPILVASRIEATRPLLRDQSVLLYANPNFRIELKSEKSIAPELLRQLEDLLKVAGDNVVLATEINTISVPGKVSIEVSSVDSYNYWNSFFAKQENSQKLGRPVVVRADLATKKEQLEIEIRKLTLDQAIDTYTFILDTHSLEEEYAQNPEKLSEYLNSVFSDLSEVGEDDYEIRYVVSKYVLIIKRAKAGAVDKILDRVDWLVGYDPSISDPLREELGE